MGYSNTGPITMTAGTALANARLVDLSTGTAIYTTAASTRHVGVTLTDVAINGDVPVGLPGTIVELTASGAVSAGALVTYAADGKVATHSAGEPVVGRAITAASDATTFPVLLFATVGDSDTILSWVGTPVDVC